MKSIISNKALSQLFTEARTYPAWLPGAVEDETLVALYELAKWGPTSMNTQPMRLVFVKGDTAKEKLLSATSAGNLNKVRAAPVTIIIGHDMNFYENLATQSPHSTNADQLFKKNLELTESTAFRNGSLQGAYVLIAARALGLDTGPMSGFDNERVDQLFFSGTAIKSNFIINIGYGDESKLYPRGPRLEFGQAARIE